MKLSFESSNVLSTFHKQLSTNMIGVGALVVVGIAFTTTFMRLEYRLGDVYRGLLSSVICRWIRIPLCYPPWSIARRYSKRTTNCSDLVILDSVVDRDPRPGLTVHLRLGDVLENHPRSTVDFLSGMFTIDPMKTREADGLQMIPSSSGVSSEGYVKPLVYYERMIEAYEGVRHVTLVGGTHKTMSMSKSLQYVDEIEKLFVQNSFVVTRRISVAPSVDRADMDVTSMANTAWFVPSGGGFSHMIAQLVCARHAMVWNDTTQTWITDRWVL